METLKVAVSAELYLPYNGILAYQFDPPDDIEHAIVAGVVSDRLHAAGGFAVLRPSIAGLSMPTAEHGFGILPTALTALLWCLRIHIMSIAEGYATTPLTPAFALDFGPEIETPTPATGVRASTTPFPAPLSYAILSVIGKSYQSQQHPRGLDLLPP